MSVVVIVAVLGLAAVVGGALDFWRPEVKPRSALAAGLDVALVVTGALLTYLAGVLA